MNQVIIPIKVERKLRPTLKGRTPDAKALAEVQALLGMEPRRRDLLIEHLHKIQDRYAQLSAAHLTALAAEMKLALAEVYEVATFYHHFDVVKEGEAAPAAITVRVCDSLSCEMAGARELLEKLPAILGRAVRVIAAPCVGRCDTAPVAVVGQNALAHATLEGVKKLVAAKALKQKPGKYIAYAEYRKHGGYRILQQCLAGKRDYQQLIKAMEDSGLRGLGGAGFPAGRKWKIVRAEPAPRLMAVNIDEGEPGTFKDRHYLERDPHRFLEGMLIAAWAVGIAEVYIYLRDEYAGCRAMLEREIAALKADPPCALPPHPPAPRRRRLHLRRGVGDDRIDRGQARHAAPAPAVRRAGRPVRPADARAQHGDAVLGARHPRARAPHGSPAHGRHGRKGLRSFSVSGRVKKPGVHLAPAGITVRELIDEYCGGMLDGHEFYAYLPGGASGGILPASMGDIPLDFDTLQPYGCFIGSAAVIMLSEHDSATRRGAAT